jgi:PAS domain S-box-containing protein
MDDEALVKAGAAAHFSGGAAFIVDHHLRYLVAEGDALAAAGLQPSDLVGKTVFEAFPRDVAEEHAANYRKALAGESFTIEHESRGRHYQTHGVPLRDAAGHVYAALAVSQDMTARRQAQALQERLQAWGKRQEFLLQLTDTLRPLAGSAEIQYAACRVLCEHLQAWRTCYMEAHSTGGALFYLVRQDFCSNQGSGTVTRHSVQDFATAMREAFLRGNTFVMHDATSDSRLTPQERAACHAAGLGAWIGVPLLKAGVVVAILSIEQQQPRRWSSDDIALVEEVAERTWAAVDRSRAEEALRQSEERFRLLVQAVSQAVWETDAQGRVIADSPSWRAYTGQTVEEFLDSGWLQVVHPEDRAHVEQHWREAVAAPCHVHVEFRLRRADGSWSWTSAQAAPVLDDAGRVLKWVGMNIDITHRKLAEEILRQSDRRKDEFLATLAHELRNPLAPLRNAAHLLAAPELQAQQLPWIQRLIERQVGHMARLLDDLLDVARITQGKLTLKVERVALSSIIESALEAARPLIEQKQHTLAISLDEDQQGELVLMADPVRLSQVLSNLLTNAAKYTDAGGRIELSARCCGSELHLSVCDNGIGLLREARTRIFEMFGQLEVGAGRAEGGLGIGLALVRGIVELHGGRVSADSAGPGQGSCFTVQLPLGAPPEMLKPDVQLKAAHAGLKVLVADDNEDAAQTLALLLSFAGCETRVVTSGQAAVQEATHWRPDVAALDIGMPDLDGYSVARTLRQQPGGANLVLIALTGWGQDSDRRNAVVAGFDHHMTKPVDVEQLLALIATSRAG